MTVDSKSHMVHLVIQEDAHRPMVFRSYSELGHPDLQGMIDSPRRKHAHRLTIVTA